MKTLGKAIVYAALASTALRFAIGSGSSSEQQTDSVTAALMTAPAGRCSWASSPSSSSGSGPITSSPG